MDDVNFEERAIKSYEKLTRNGVGLLSFYEDIKINAGDIICNQIFKILYSELEKCIDYK